MSSTTATTTQDLDKLLEELRRTSLDYSSTTRSSAPYLNGAHSSRAYSNHQRSTFVDPGGNSAGRYSTRSYSFTGKGGNRQSGRWTSTSSSTATSYQRSQAYSTERGASGMRGGLTGENEGFVRHATPAPQIPSSQQQRYQTTFRTTLQHRPPVSPKKFNQINVTIDPEIGMASSSTMADNRGYLTPSLSRAQTASATTTQMDEGSEGMSYRELQLLEELSSARQELAMLKRASSVIDEPLHKLPPPSTLPTQRRIFQQHQENTEMFSNRHQTQYQSHHDIQQGSTLYLPHGRYDTMNSGFAFGVPKRAMSSANVTASQSWNCRNGMMSGPQSPALGYSSMRSMGGSLRSGRPLPGSQGYSARRERLRQEAEQAEALRQSTQRINHIAAASSNDLRSTSLHQQRRQHYHSMSTIQPERTEIEEIETVTLQPIGRGVQDLGSNMGSTATLNRSTRRPVASSMLEGLNRMDNYTGTRQQTTNMSSFGRQTSAMDIPQAMSARPQRTTSNSYLSSLRRQSAGTMSETSSLQQNMPTNKSANFASQQLRPQQLGQNQQHAPIHQQASQQSAKFVTKTMLQSQEQPVLFQSTQSLQQQQQQQQQYHNRNDIEWSSHQTSSSSSIPAKTNGPVDLALVEATSPVWYRLKISRQEAISILKNQPPGSFLVRDSTTFKDAYGLAVKSTKPPNKTGQKSGFAKFMKNILNDINNDLVRHYLIETVTTPTHGVRIKGFSAEQVYPNLLALIQHHTQFPVALPCCLVLPPIPPSQTGPVLTASGSKLVRNGPGSSNGNGGDSDSITLVQNNGGIGSLSQTPVSFNGNAVTTETLEAPPPARSITSPLSPTAGMFHSELMSPPPNISCRCLYLGAVEVNPNQDQEQANVMQAVDELIPGPVLQATTCDHMGAESPVQYTECQLQAAHNEGILLTDLSRKLFFQRHFSANSFIYAGVDPRDKAFIHPNHSALGLDKPKLFGIIIKKLSGEYMVHVFSEFDANCGAAIISAQINSLLLNK